MLKSVKYSFPPFRGESIYLTEDDELEAVIDVMNEQMASLSSNEGELSSERLKFYQDALDKGESVLVKLQKRMCLRKNNKAKRR
jgi:hypothetical protein